MFGMGMGELLLIFVIALLVFGPEKLPQVARSVGKAMRDLKRTTNDIRYSIEREINMSELKETLDLPAEVSRQMRDVVLPPDEVERRRQRVLKGEPPIPEHDPYADAAYHDGPKDSMSVEDRRASSSETEPDA